MRGISGFAGRRLLYYLTQTRPALDNSWLASREISATVRRRSLEKMISRNRVPRYLVRVRVRERLDRSALTSERVKRDHPLHAFAAERYAFQVEFWNMEIWKRRP